MSTLAGLLSPWIGFSSGVIAWFIVTQLRSGAINVSTTGDATNAVAGNITSWGAGFLSSIILSFMFPKKFTSTDEGHIARANKINGVSPEARSPETITPAEPVLPSDKTPLDTSPSNTENNKDPASNPAPDTLVRTGNEIVDFLEAQNIEPMNPAEVKRAIRLAVGFNVLFLVVAILFVPFLLFGGEWIFPRKMFIGWCVVSFLWVWCSMIICVIWPVVESRVTIWFVFMASFLAFRNLSRTARGPSQLVS
jgi:hypothetical protein